MIMLKLIIKKKIYEYIAGMFRPGENPGKPGDLTFFTKKPGTRGKPGENPGKTRGKPGDLSGKTFKKNKNNNKIFLLLKINYISYTLLIIH